MNIKNEVYKVVAKIPKGRVMTYGQIAKILKLRTPRIVGKYLHQNQNSEKVPCHRVVFADGSLSKSYAMGGLTAQKKRLLSEGVKFNKDKVDLS